MARFESLDPEIRGVLGKKVSELGLRLEGSPVEGYVAQLNKELERRGLKRFRPVCYLTDEWGCPDQQPVLGIPFYLADPKLRTLEKAVDTAAQKGSKESLILSDNAAFIVSVRNKTVITVLDRNQMNGNVFTNIDSTVVI